MKSLTREAMEARVARFDKLQTYQRQNFEAHGIPAGAVEKITARRGAAPLVIRRCHDGINAPVKGPRGLIVSIAECEPGNGPGLHRHLNTVENFMCLSGRFEIAWGAGYDRAGKVTRRAIRFPMRRVSPKKSRTITAKARWRACKRSGSSSRMNRQVRLAPAPAP